ncbi:MAG: CDP-glucose 4,6-dehydratase [Geminicoccaceae bacterium]|jgi:CDP-glucose 4,6-dehydratase|nr:CDP-glucose 4,6-dehydratase [Geminicoccaceae bacterium]
MTKIDPTFWLNRRVLVTGHTGFKGSYLAAWLSELGADIVGVAHPPAPPAGLFALAGLDQRLLNVTADVRDRARLEHLVVASSPEIVFHLAAQPVVLDGLKRPLDTFDTNIQGTLNILQAARRAPDLRAMVVVTSDKAYRPSTEPRGEADHLGGIEPYSASKACADIIAEAYRHCYLSPEDGIGLATARAGNVIGGGDFAADRLVPDLVRGIAAGRTVPIRHPDAIRPWQHVLDAVHGYLLLAEALATAPRRFARAWNFGPVQAPWPVRDVADRLVARLGGQWAAVPMAGRHETPVLRLDPTAAIEELGWRPRLDTAAAVDWTAEGYRRLEAEASGRFVLDQIERFSDLRPVGEVAGRGRPATGQPAEAHAHA